MKNTSAFAGLTFLMSLFFVPPALAQVIPSNPHKALEIQQKRGDLFAVKLVPGSREVQIHVVGTKAAQMNFEKTGLKLLVRVNGEMREVGVEKRKNYFAVKEKLERPSELILDLSHEGQNEKLEMPLK